MKPSIDISLIIIFVIVILCQIVYSEEDVLPTIEDLDINYTTENVHADDNISTNETTIDLNNNSSVTGDNGSVESAGAKEKPESLNSEPQKQPDHQYEITKTAEKKEPDTGTPSEPVTNPIKTNTIVPVQPPASSETKNKPKDTSTGTKSKKKDKLPIGDPPKTIKTTPKTNVPVRVVDPGAKEARPKPDDKSNVDDAEPDEDDPGAGNKDLDDGPLNDPSQGDKTKNAEPAVETREPANKPDEKKITDALQPVFPEQENSHFFAYFLTVVAVCILGYFLLHNKQKIIALIVEGRHNRRKRLHSYRKLESEGSKANQPIF